jgi:hypothetical protein
MTAFAILAALVMACGGGATGDKATPVGGADDRGFRNFRERIENAQEEGFEVYWLGREFTAGGLTFRGPSVPDYGDEVDGGEWSSLMTLARQAAAAPASRYTRLVQAPGRFASNEIPVAYSIRMWSAL